MLDEVISSLLTTASENEIERSITILQMRLDELQEEEEEE